MPCSYCGRLNPSGLPACPGCGTPVSEREPLANNGPAKKSKSVAILLALIFGPLGLIYVRGWKSAGIMILIRAPFVLSHTFFFWTSIGSSLISAAIAYSLVVEQEKVSNPQYNAERLLNAAARLENVDFQRAIVAYEEIILQYPETSASKQAASAIETLKRSA